jgi:CheY-like chemotaxis protein
VNGRDGVDALIAADEEDDPVDVVIMDIEMPVMDGHEATRTIRALGFDDEESEDDIDDPDDRRARRARRRLLARTPIIAMTANSLRDDRTRCFEAGMDEFAGKPVSRAKLAEVIGAMLDKRAKDVATNGRSEGGGSIASCVDLPDDLDEIEPVPSAALPKQLRVLLADDAEEVRTVFSLALKSLGCIVDEYGDGAPAVAAFAKHPVSHYHLVLLDLNMPDIGGIQAAREMRIEEHRRAAGEAVHMVAVTGEDEGSVGAECAEAGFDGVISKPVTRQGLSKLTEQVWEQLRSKKSGKPKKAQRKKVHNNQRNRGGSVSASDERDHQVSRSPARIRFSRKSPISGSPSRHSVDSGGESTTSERDDRLGSSSRRRKKASLKAKSKAPPDPGEPERRIQQRRSVAATTLSPPQ